MVFSATRLSTPCSNGAWAAAPAASTTMRLTADHTSRYYGTQLKHKTAPTCKTLPSTLLLERHFSHMATLSSTTGPRSKLIFLGLERTPWYDTHYSKFSLKGQEQGKDTVSKYYETKFISQVNKQLSTQDCHTVTHHGPRPIASTLPMYSSPT